MQRRVRPHEREATIQSISRSPRADGRRGASTTCRTSPLASPYRSPWLTPSHRRSPCRRLPPPARRTRFGRGSHLLGGGDDDASHERRTRRSRRSPRSRADATASPTPRPDGYRRAPRERLSLRGSARAASSHRRIRQTPGSYRAHGTRSSPARNADTRLRPPAGTGRARAHSRTHELAFRHEVVEGPPELGRVDLIALDAHDEHRRGDLAEELASGSGQSCITPRIARRRPQDDRAPTGACRARASRAS